MTFALGSKKMSLARTAGVGVILAFAGQTLGVSGSNRPSLAELARLRRQREAAARENQAQHQAPATQNENEAVPQNNSQQQEPAQEPAARVVELVQPVFHQIDRHDQLEQSHEEQQNEVPEGDNREENQQQNPSHSSLVEEINLIQAQPNPQPTLEQNLFLANLVMTAWDRVNSLEEEKVPESNLSEYHLDHNSQDQALDAAIWNSMQQPQASSQQIHSGQAQLLAQLQPPQGNSQPVIGQNVQNNQQDKPITRRAYQHEHYRTMHGVQGVHGETPTYTYHTDRPNPANGQHGIDRSQLYQGSVFNKIPLMHSYHPDHVDPIGEELYHVGTGARYHRQFFNGVFSVGKQDEAGNSDIQFNNLPDFLKKTLENPALCAPNLNTVTEILTLRRYHKNARRRLRSLQQQQEGPVDRESRRVPHSRRDERQTAAEARHNEIRAVQRHVDQLQQQIRLLDCSEKLKLKKLNVVIADMREDAQNQHHQGLLYRPHYAIHHATRNGVPYNEQTHLRVALGDSDFCEYIEPRMEWDFRKQFDYTKSAGDGAETDAFVWDEYAWTHPDYDQFPHPQIASSHHNPLAFFSMQAANNQPGNGNQQQQAHIKTVAAQESGSWFAVHNAIPWGDDMSRTARRLNRNTGRPVGPPVREPEPKRVIGSQVNGRNDIVNFNDGEPSPNNPLQNKTNEVVATFYWKIKSNISHPRVPKTNNRLGTAESKLLDILRLAAGSVDSLRNRLRDWATQQRNIPGWQQAARFYNLIRPAGENPV